MSKAATVFTEIDGDMIGINVKDYDGDLHELLSDFYVSYDEAVTLIESGSFSYLTSSVEESDVIDMDGEVEILQAFDFGEFIDTYGETYNFFFDPDLEEWVYC